MGTHPIFESDFDCLTDGYEMDLDSLLAYTVDKRQRNAEAASPELRKEAILSNTVKRAHRLLSMSHDEKISSFLSDDSFSDSDNHDEHIDVTNEEKSTQQLENTHAIHDNKSMSDQTAHQSHSNKRKRTEPVVPATDVEMVQSPLKKSRAECNEKLNNLSLGGDT